MVYYLIERTELFTRPCRENSKVLRDGADGQVPYTLSLSREHHHIVWIMQARKDPKHRPALKLALEACLKLI